MKPKGRCVAVVSGGLDSVTLAYHLVSEGYGLHILNFAYGQRHWAREHDCAEHAAHALGAEYTCLDLSSYGLLLTHNALTGNIAVPHGKYDDRSMACTVVPNRNVVFLALAFGVAVDEAAAAVAIAVHAGDHFIYPDCRGPFLSKFAEMQRFALADQPRVPTLLAPFIFKTKGHIVTRGAELGVPFAQTYSCYEGGALHCGRCGTCRERIEAFDQAGIPDPTIYACCQQPCEDCQCAPGPSDPEAKTSGVAETSANKQEV